jgi:hypothetical protein
MYCIALYVSGKKFRTHFLPAGASNFLAKIFYPTFPRVPLSIDPPLNGSSGQCKNKKYFSAASLFSLFQCAQRAFGVKQHITYFASKK